MVLKADLIFNWCWIFESLQDLACWHPNGGILAYSVDQFPDKQEQARPVR